MQSICGMTPACASSGAKGAHQSGPAGKIPANKKREDRTAFLPIINN